MSKDSKKTGALLPPRILPTFSSFPSTYSLYSKPFCWIYNKSGDLRAPSLTNVNKNSSCCCLAAHSTIILNVWQIQTEGQLYTTTLYRWVNGSLFPELKYLPISERWNGDNSSNEWTKIMKSEHWQACTRCLHETAAGRQCLSSSVGTGHIWTVWMGDSLGVNEGEPQESLNWYLHGLCQNNWQ